MQGNLALSLHEMETLTKVKVSVQDAHTYACTNRHDIRFSDRKVGRPKNHYKFNFCVIWPHRLSTIHTSSSAGKQACHSVVYGYNRSGLKHLAIITLTHIITSIIWVIMAKCFKPNGHQGHHFRSVEANSSPPGPSHVIGPSLPVG